MRTGAFFPALLEPRRRIDVALHAVVMQAYVEGVSTCRVDDLVVALGARNVIMVKDELESLPLPDVSVDARRGQHGSAPCA